MFGGKGIIGSALVGNPIAGNAAVGPDRAERRPRECGDLPFLVRRDGVWLYRGSPIERKEMVCLFSSALRRDAAGEYWIETPAERGRIQVEDTPWLAVELDWRGCGCRQVLTFRTNVDQVIEAGPEHRLRIDAGRSHCTPVPYLHVRAGAGDKPLEARVARHVYYELAALAEPGECRGRACLGVWSQGCFFPLGDAATGCADAPTGAEERWTRS